MNFLKDTMNTQSSLLKWYELRMGKKGSLEQSHAEINPSNNTAGYLSSGLSKILRSLTGAFCPASQTRVGIIPPPSRVLSTIPRAFLGRYSFRVTRVFWPPNSSRTLVAIPRARDGVKPSR